MDKNTLKTVLPTVFLMLAYAIPVTGQTPNSLYSDVKAGEIGDIITIVLMENISGSSTADARKSSNANGSAGGSVSSNFIPFEPTFNSGASVDYGSDEQNLSSQKQLLEGYMSVRIVEISPQGDLIVEGSRLTEINGEKHQMELTGMVRPNDVDGQNRVLSYRVANADISYHQEGGIKEKMTKKRGLIRRIVFGGLGAALGAAIIVKSM